MNEVKSIHHSYWIKSPSAGGRTQRYESLQHNIETDVAVIGAGITGLSTALELLVRGFRVSVFEASVIGAGTTGGSTGHLDAHPEMGPAALLKKAGHQKARQFVHLRRDAINAIESRCHESCQFRRVPAYSYSEQASDADELRRNFDAARQCGLDVEWVDSVPLPFAACGYRIDHMGRFDCLAYLHRLAELVTEAGGHIYENSAAEKPSQSHSTSLQVGGQRVAFQHLVWAVHSNFTSAVQIDMQLPAYQSYVLAARVTDPPPDALFWDNADPYHYIRRLSDADDHVLLIGGCDHRTGVGDPLSAEEELESYARERFGKLEIVSRWSAEFFEPVDGFPFIGRVPLKENVWIAAGFSGIGLTWGTAAGWLLADQIRGQETPLQEELSPGRLNISGLPTMAAEQMTAVGNLAERVLPAHRIDPADLKLGEGDVGKVDSVHMAICQDEQGCEHRRSPICTHMGGVVHWNAAEQTWDCPVHGGRYAADGQRIYGPPDKDLEPAE